MTTRTATEDEWAAIVAMVATKRPEHAKVLAAGRTTFTKDGVTIAPPPGLAEKQPAVLMTTIHINEGRGPKN